MAITNTDEGICIDNFKAAGVREGKNGLAVIANDSICKTAGVFTRNKIQAAPITINKEKVGNGLRAIVINSGNANACNKKGIENARKMCKHTAEKLGIKEENVGVASTGIIGKELDINLIKKQIEKTTKLLSNTPEGSSSRFRSKGNAVNDVKVPGKVTASILFKKNI